MSLSRSRKDHGGASAPNVLGDHRPAAVDGISNVSDLRLREGDFERTPKLLTWQGRVVDAWSTVPLQNATVRAIDEGGDVIQTLSTPNDGSFLFALSCPLVLYEVSCPGFAGSIVPPRTTGPTEIPLWPTSLLVCSVIAPDGTPAPDVVVRVWSERGAGPWTAEKSAVTDPTGQV
jgi:hypothetical protein